MEFAWINTQLMNALHYPGCKLFTKGEQNNKIHLIPLGDHGGNKTPPCSRTLPCSLHNHSGPLKCLTPNGSLNHHKDILTNKVRGGLPMGIFLHNHTRQILTQSTHNILQIFLSYCQGLTHLYYLHFLNNNCL